METAGVEPGSHEMNQIIDEHERGTLSWKGWPKNSALKILLSIVIYFVSILISVTALAYDDEGSESGVMVVLRVFALTLGVSGACVFSSRKTLPGLASSTRVRQ